MGSGDGILPVSQAAAWGCTEPDGDPLGFAAVVVVVAAAAVGGLCCWIGEAVVAGSADRDNRLSGYEPGGSLLNERAQGERKEMRLIAVRAAVLTLGILVNVGRIMRGLIVGAVLRGRRLVVVARLIGHIWAAALEEMGARGEGERGW